MRSARAAAGARLVWSGACRMLVLRLVAAYLGERSVSCLMMECHSQFICYKMFNFS